MAAFEDCSQDGTSGIAELQMTSRFGAIARLALAGVLVCISEGARACGGGEMLFVPLGFFGAVIPVILLFWFLSWPASSPSSTPKALCSVLMATGGLFLLGGGLVLTGIGGGVWHCSFSNSIYMIFAMHLGLPLAAALISLLWVARELPTSKLLGLINWAIWGTLLGDILVEIATGSGDAPVSPKALMRPMHYATVATLMIGMVAVPWGASRMPRANGAVYLTASLVAVVNLFVILTAALHFVFP